MRIFLRILEQGVTFALAESNGRLQETLTKAGLAGKIGRDRISPLSRRCAQGVSNGIPTGRGSNSSEKSLIRVGQHGVALAMLVAGRTFLRVVRPVTAKHVRSV